MIDITIGRWIKTMPRWKRFLFHLIVPIHDEFAIQVFGYDRWKQAEIKKEHQNRSGKET